jgi:hypothetical protein
MLPMLLRDVLINKTLLASQVRDSLSIVLVLSFLDPKHSFFPLLIAESL